MLVWQDIWIVLRPGQRVEFVRRTFFFDPDFGASMLDVAYATRIANFGTRHDMDESGITLAFTVPTWLDYMLALPC